MTGITPFTRHVAMILALLILRASTCGAASLVPGSIGILECNTPDHEIRAAWERASREVRLDPLLLALNEDEIASVLGEWSEAAEVIEMAWRTADRAVLEKVQSLLDEAWKFYYAFGFEKALDRLIQADGLLASPGDSRFRSRLAFEISILKGMVRRAMGDGRSRDEFRRAASFSPASELSTERYSPEVISEYSRARRELVSNERILVDIDLNPSDAVVLVDGVNAELEKNGTQLRVFPGRHFLEARTPGYEPFGYVLDAGQWDSPSLKLSLIRNGPEGEPDMFFLGRLAADDRPYLARLCEKLDVDYILIPDGTGRVLNAWIVGRDGRSAVHGNVWEPGDDPETAVRNLSVMVRPLRQARKDVRHSRVTQLNLPPVPELTLESAGNDNKDSDWKKYSVILGVLVLVAAFTTSQSGEGGTTVEVSW